VFLAHPDGKSIGRGGAALIQLRDRSSSPRRCGPHCLGRGPGSVPSLAISSGSGFCLLSSSPVLRASMSLTAFLSSFVEGRTPKRSAEPFVRACLFLQRAVYVRTISLSARPKANEGPARTIRNPFGGRICRAWHRHQLAAYALRMGAVGRPCAQPHSAPRAPGCSGRPRPIAFMGGRRARAAGAVGGGVGRLARWSGCRALKPSQDFSLGLVGPVRESAFGVKRPSRPLGAAGWLWPICDLPTWSDPVCYLG
jgi:hypothetical protein